MGWFVTVTCRGVLPLAPPIELVEYGFKLATRVFSAGKLKWPFLFDNSLYILDQEKVSGTALKGFHGKIEHNKAKAILEHPICQFALKSSLMNEVF